MPAHVGDIGTDIIFDVGESLSSATVHTLKYRKPNGAVGSWNATVVGNTLKFTTSALSDLDVVGKWLIQAYVEMPAWKGHSDSDTMYVAPNVEVA
jgi:hypothetical protein